MQTQLFLYRHRGLLLLLLGLLYRRGFKMQSSDVSAFPHRLPHRYDSKRPLPSPESIGGEEKIKKIKSHTYETSFTICHQGPGNRNNTNKAEIDFICSSISLSQAEWHSPSLAIWRTSARLSRRIGYGRGGERGPRQKREGRRRVQNKAFQIGLLKDQTVTGDHGDVFWRKRNREVFHAHMRSWELLRNLKARKTWNMFR